jgi:hypothetical protein
MGSNQSYALGGIGNIFCGKRVESFLTIAGKIDRKSSGLIKVPPLMAAYDVSGVAALKLKSSFIEM